MFVCAKSDIGMKRKENQDNFRLGRLSDNSVYAVVCDGMGGASAGSVASSVAAEEIAKRIANGYRKGASELTMKNLLTTAVSAANTIVYQKSIKEPEKHGMGTTCVSAIVGEDKAYIASVGDSRAYLIENGEISQVTNDHTYVEMLYQQGKINKEEVNTHDMRHYITKAVGIERKVEVDFFEVDVKEGTSVLLCTDGLTNFCDNDMILQTVMENGPEAALEQLIDCANSKGGKDNITVAIITTKC